MHLNKNILLILILILGESFIQQKKVDNLTHSAKWVVSKGGFLRVNGSTNVSTFSCIVPEYVDPDTITCINKDLPILMSGNISLNIFGFDCHNTLMTADLRKTLRAKEFPKMRIHFLSLNKFPELRSTEETITGWVNIELSGVTKKFDVKFRFYTDDQKIIHLIGIRSINFSDFNLTPPRKLGGIIQTKDKLDVEFGLNFKTLN
ncbi:YceI-like domain protein [mine drainage metagenome]|uniref:YceI-like domain protein n=1 Tax=mine drainage metagenome TaxID=410659 RepID=A0A1J5T0A1_9ZZZZ